jgi:sugar phosphate isomerase/epimerase
MDPDPDRRAVRIDFLRRAIEIARQLEAGCVSLWSGSLAEPIPHEQAMDRLAASLRPVLDQAEAAGIPLAFEPEPGMFVDTFDRFRQLDERINHTLFQLTVDLGHVHCIEDEPIAEHLRRWAPRIVNIHIEDMVRGIHEHLMFGEGTMDFPPIIQALGEVGYRGALHVELSRHSYSAIEAVRSARAFLGPLAII